MAQNLVAFSEKLNFTYHSILAYERLNCEFQLLMIWIPEQRFPDFRIKMSLLTLLFRGFFAKTNKQSDRQRNSRKFGNRFFLFYIHTNVVSSFIFCSKQYFEIKRDYLPYRGFCKLWTNSKNIPLVFLFCV